MLVTYPGTFGEYMSLPSYSTIAKLFTYVPDNGADENDSATPAQDWGRWGIIPSLSVMLICRVNRYLLFSVTFIVISNCCIVLPNCRVHSSSCPPWVVCHKPHNRCCFWKTPRRGCSPHWNTRSAKWYDIFILLFILHHFLLFDYFILFINSNLNDLGSSVRRCCHPHIFKFHRFVGIDRVNKKISFNYFNAYSFSFLKKQ